LLGRDGKEVLRLALPMGSLVVGLSFSLAISFLRGLLESEGEFERTPKGGEKPIGCWYQPTMDGSYFLEIFIPLFYVAVLAINRDSPWFLELSVAWVATAFFSVGVSTLRSFSARSESWSP